MARRYTDAEKAQALDLYAQVGVAEAARQMDIPAGTIKAWASRTGAATVATANTEAATKANALRWAERRTAMVDQIGRVAGKALDLAETLLDDQATSKAKDAATTMAILVDKAQLLGGDATSRHENRELRDKLLTEAREHGRHLRSVA